MADLLFSKKSPQELFKPKQKSLSGTLQFILFILIFLFSLYFIFLSLFPSLPENDQPPQFYSNQCRQDLRSLIVHAINEARESIHLVIFGLSDGAILQSLKAQIRNGIETTIYCDPHGSPQFQSALLGAEFYSLPHSGLMHHKILIIDKSLVFLGSANFTTTSLHMHDNLVIGFKNSKVAQFLRDHTPHHPGYLKTQVGGQTIELWLLPDPRGHALSQLRHAIRNAKTSIQTALFTFTHPLLAEELIAAQNRGVKVSLAIDLHGGLGASAPNLEKLRQAKVPILYNRGPQLLHHKFILIDESTLITGSANWTKAAFYKNSDSILILHHLTKDQRRFMKSLWKKIASGTQSRFDKTT